jgi:hypothetical protein
MSYHIRGVITRYQKVIPIVIALVAIAVYILPLDLISAQRGPPDSNPYAQRGRGPPPGVEPGEQGPPEGVPRGPPETPPGQQR